MALYIHELLRGRGGQGTVEYVFIASLIALAVFTVLGLMTGGVQRVFQLMVDMLAAIAW